MQDSFISNLKRFDQQRPSLPGEHWLALAAGLWFLRKSGGSALSRFSSKAIGAALIYRAASGRDGLRRLWGPGSGRGGVIEPAAPRGALHGARTPRAHLP